ncbi:hypothetical protein [Spirillospora sp. CA-294931]|uniref:hypothetical protein n=1 Tax=Spirillospora sp. CA-294931 TaxID=3240042 RepID=UPI003D948F6E
MNSTYPDITRDDVGVVLINQWDVGTRERQLAGAEAIARGWSAGAPPRGSVSLNLYVSDDGTSLLAYKPWTSHDAYRAFAETERTPLTGEVAPGVTREEPVEYRLYRTAFDGDGGDGDGSPGSIVIVQFETADADAARTLVDTLIETYDGVDLPPGGLGSHFHIATDGSRMLNYAEFVDAASHERLISGETGRNGRLPELLAGLDGIRPLGFKRYTLHTSITRG